MNHPSLRPCTSKFGLLQELLRSFLTAITMTYFVISFPSFPSLQSPNLGLYNPIQPLLSIIRCGNQSRSLEELSLLGRLDHFIFLFLLVAWFHIMAQCDTAPLGDFGIPTTSRSHRNSMRIPRKTSWGAPIPLPSTQKDPTDQAKEDFDDVDLSTNEKTSASSDKHEGWNTLDNIAALGLSFNAEDSQVVGTPIRERFSLDEAFVNRSLPLGGERPFNKWMKSLQRRGTQRWKTVSCDMGGTVLDPELFDTSGIQKRSAHKKSSSGSSFGFVTAVKSASISLASFSAAPRSRRTGVSSRQQRTDRSSKASNVGRLSEDSSYIARGIIIDQAVTNRLLQRRRVLEEIINTEESYLADVRFLMNVSLSIFFKTTFLNFARFM